MLTLTEILSVHPRSGMRQRGAYALIFALLLIPLIGMVGLALDYARMVQYKSDLQNAVDSAALAGASAYTANTSQSQAAAVTAATNYFNRAILPTSVSVGAPTVTTNSSGTLNPALSTNAAYTVTVHATAVVKNTLFSTFIASNTISATGTAADPVVFPNFGWTKPGASACDTNTAYLYAVPLNKDGVGYDYGSPPVFNATNYYFLGSSNSSVTAPAGQTLPNFSANQPLGIALVNTTNGNTGTCGGGASLTGANSYGSPNGGSQIFYSSLLLNGQSPSELSNQTYPVAVTNTTTTVSTSYGGTPTTTSSTAITGVTVTPPSVPGAASSPTLTYGSGGTYPLASGSYNILPYYVGEASCTVSSTGTPTTPVVTTSTTQINKTTTRTITTSTSSQTISYLCTEQYRTQAGNSSSYTSNCSLYMQTNVSQSYVNGLSNSSAAPAAAIGNCFTVAGGNAAYASPSCAQLSALANDGSAPDAVFWWDDAGGEGPDEPSYGPVSHCAGMSSTDPGYGEDCQYKNNHFAIGCTTSGGTTTGSTEVILTQ